MIDPIISQGLCEFGLALLVSAVIALIGKLK
jgi:hypothetical protein